MYRQDEKLKPADPYLTQSLYGLAFLQVDQHKMAELESAALIDQGIGDEMLVSRAATAVWYGKVSAARELTERAGNIALHNGAKESAARYWATEALYEMEVGDVAQARADLEAATRLATNRDVRVLAPLVMASATRRQRRSYPPSLLKRTQLTRRFKVIGCRPSRPLSPYSVVTRSMLLRSYRQPTHSN